MATTTKTSEEDSARTLAAIVLSSQDAIFAKTFEGIITHWNKGAEKLYGYTAKEAVGRSVAIMTPPDRPDELPGILARIHKGERVEPYETERIRKDGRIIHVSLSISPVYNQKGGIIAAATIARDRTEHRALEEVSRKNIQLETTNQILDSFSHALAHELRNPLTSLKTSVSLLREEYWDKLDTPGEKLLEIVGQGTERIIGIVRDLQDLNITSRPVIHSEPVDLSSLAQTEANRLKITQPERRMTWRIADGLTAKGDTGLLRLALTNLLRNAWKFTTKTKNPIIEFGMSLRDKVPVYFVRDNGAGFDMADAHKLFQPFSRLHTEKAFAGTGIGLTIVEKVIRRHNGCVWAEGKVPGGATFFFTLGTK